MGTLSHTVTKPDPEPDSHERAGLQGRGGRRVDSPRPLLGRRIPVSGLWQVEMCSWPNPVSLLLLHGLPTSQCGRVR